jgi:hypothetical protein
VEEVNVAYVVSYMELGAHGPREAVETIEADDYQIEGKFTTFTNDTVKVLSLPTDTIHSIKKTESKD